MIVRWHAVLLGVAICLAPPARAKLIIQFDYSLDSSGFFNSGTADGQAARAALERAAQTYTDRFLDSFTAIADRNAVERWFATVNNPSTGIVSNVHGLSIPQNVVKVYAGSRLLNVGEAGRGGPGGAGVDTYFPGDPASVAWYDNVRSRGQTGVLSSPPTDFARWGGSVAFDDSTPFHFGLTTAGLDFDEVDFLTVATHELGHLLGFTAGQESFSSKVVNSRFTGAKTVAVNGGVGPLMTAGHFVEDTASTVGGQPQIALMDPVLTTGTRRRLTLLDWAVLDDIGWALALAGDTNADGVVNFADFQRLERSIGKTAARWADGDFNEDLIVNHLDFNLLFQNFGQSAGGAAVPVSASDWDALAAFGASVPEPGAAALFTGVVVALAIRRRA